METDPKEFTAGVCRSWLKSASFAGALTLLLITVASTPAAENRAVQSVPQTFRYAFTLSPFYEKLVDCNGLPVLSSAKVSNTALLEAAWIIDQMLQGREDIRRAIVSNKVRVAVMAFDQFTSDIPEHSDLTPKDYWDKRARGLGATRRRPAVSCGEENLLNFPGDPYSTENILVHEFGHVIHEMGLRYMGLSFDERLGAAFQQAIDAGLWKNTYAASSKQEYWAEGVQSWFDTNRENDRDHNHVNTREELQAYDPVLAKLLSEVFGKNPWRYSSAKSRSQADHLKAFDFTKSPTFRWPARLVAEVAKTFTKPPGVVIAHSAAARGIYLGSPGIVTTSDGVYVAKCDEFGPASSEYVEAITRLYHSTNRGSSWTQIAIIKGLFWASLFAHRESLYLLGTDRHDGRIVIMRSNDEGHTWTKPNEANSGLLTEKPGYHCAPVPIVVHNGRLWRAMEDTFASQGSGSRLRSFMMSAPVDADLLRAEAWSFSNSLKSDRSWLGGKFGGWLEGNAVVARDGQIVNVLRADYHEAEEKSAIVKISPDGTKASFDPYEGFVDFPGGCKKFTIRYDPVSERYWSLVNYVPPQHRGGNPERTRNTLALTSSPDLRNWTVRAIVLYHPDPLKHAFQYVDWQFESPDIIAVSRTAFDDEFGGAANQHDANYITFHRVENFRNLNSGEALPAH